MHKPAFSQDQLRVVGEGKFASGELIDKNIRDANGLQASGIKIKTDLTALSIEANNGVIKMNTNPGIYFVFLSPDERVITIRKTGYLELKVVLPEVGIRLKSGQVWELTVTGDKKLEQVPVNFMVKQENVELKVDGKMQKPPYQGIILSVGKHQVEIQKEGFAHYNSEIEVTSKKNLFEISLKQVALVAVEFRSNPVGAKILIDDLEKGITPKGLFLYPGKYQVKWSLNGYSDNLREIEIIEGGDNTFHEVLTKNAGKLVWETKPKEAKVFINKELQVDKQEAELSPGRYHIEVTAEGYVTYTETIEIQSREQVSKKWTLLQQMGGMQFSVDPLDAQVVMRKNGKIVKSWKGLFASQEIPIGVYELSILMSGYQTKVIPIQIEKQKVITIDEKLLKGIQEFESKRNQLGMEFVKIPAGSFMMGSENSNKNDKPVHHVVISSDFFLSKYEVTQKQWTTIIGSNPSRFKGENLPVENISWDDIQIYIAKLNEMDTEHSYRLPTEAEWEYANRAGSSTKWHFGDDRKQITAFAWVGLNSKNTTHPIGQKKPNNWSLHDMDGNVMEWVQDRHKYLRNYYEISPEIDPKGFDDGDERVVRGGHWNGYNNYSYVRVFMLPSTKNSTVGFRLVVFKK